MRSAASDRLMCANTNGVGVDDAGQAARGQMRATTRLEQVLPDDHVEILVRPGRIAARSSHLVVIDRAGRCGTGLYDFQHRTLVGHEVRTY